MSKTAECVTFAHPDKVCDQISDAILDAYLERDPYSRVAVEAMGGHGMINVCGEVSSRERISDDDLHRIIESVYRDCGYTDTIGCVLNIEQQSREIARGVDDGGAGDQGVMIGYATSESPDLLPLEFSLARRLCRAMGPRDGKAQVTIEGNDTQYGTDRRTCPPKLGERRRKPVTLTIITSVCGFDDQVHADLSREIEHIRNNICNVEEPFRVPFRHGRLKPSATFQDGTNPVLCPADKYRARVPEKYFPAISDGVRNVEEPFPARRNLGEGGRVPALPEITWHANPNGLWTTGGFLADTGLTGRKIVVDAYGPRVPVGGGAFSGKDPSKVDRSGAYMARRIAVDYLTRLGASEVRCELAYSIGLAEPVSAIVCIDGQIEPIHGYDLRPAAIIEHLSLLRPIYRDTAKLGAFGNGFAWDRLDQSVTLF